MMKLLIRCLVLLLMIAGTAHSSLTENFNDITTLPGAGWVQTNNSSPLGTTGWFQGNDGIFPAQAGAPDAYIAANFFNADTGGNISNWLLTPTLTMNNDDKLSFFTRSSAIYPDRLEVRLSTNGGSTSVGDFSSLLLTINPLLSASGYPSIWTQYTVSLSGLGGPTDGRFAFHYSVPDTSVNADYIGIDTVSVTPVPAPSTFILLGSGIASLGFLRRRFVGLK
jgi:hypothetical protein